MCIFKIRSDAHAKSISPAEEHTRLINPSLMTNIHRRSSFLEEDNQNEIHNRRKRVVVFRPLFVYRQQQIQKTRLKDGESGNYGSQENHQPISQQPIPHQPIQQDSNLGVQQVHHHHHHHHHHYPEGVQQTYDSRY